MYVYTNEGSGIDVASRRWFAIYPIARYPLSCVSMHASRDLDRFIPTSHSTGKWSGYIGLNNTTHTGGLSVGVHQNSIMMDHYPFSYRLLFFFFGKTTWKNASVDICRLLHPQAIPPPRPISAIPARILVQHGNGSPKPNPLSPDSGQDRSSGRLDGP
jgi:hypothetical protein